jgi:putative aminopeptidase FrvX
MKKLSLFITFWLCVLFSFPQSSVSIEEIVRYLSSPELEGRRMGTKGDTLAIEYLVNQFEKMEIKPLLSQYEQGFQTFCFKRVSKQLIDSAYSRNVIAFVEGTDEKLKEEYIVVCAHFDHVGVKKDKLYPGANDNASGTATVLFLADYFAKNPVKKSIIFACFAGEEMGLVGSRFFVDILPELLPKIQCVINFDMVGRYDLGGLRILGEGFSKLLKETVKNISEKGEFKTKKSALPFMASDQYTFYKKKISFLCFNTGNDLKNYHKSSDDADKIDFKGIEMVANFAAQIVQELGNNPKKPVLKRMENKK